MLCYNSVQIIDAWNTVFKTFHTDITLDRLKSLTWRAQPLASLQAPQAATMVGPGAGQEEDRAQCRKVAREPANRSPCIQE